MSKMGKRQIQSRHTQAGHMLQIHFSHAKLSVNFLFSSQVLSQFTLLITTAMGTGFVCLDSHGARTPLVRSQG
jgi:hypothetical protein